MTSSPKFGEQRNKLKSTPAEVTRGEITAWHVRHPENRAYRDKPHCRIYHSTASRRNIAQSHNRYPLSKTQPAAGLSFLSYRYPTCSSRDHHALRQAARPGGRPRRGPRSTISCATVRTCDQGIRTWKQRCEFESLL